jgi:hypothetical protein
VYTVFNSPLHNSDIETIVVDDECTVWMCTEKGITSAREECIPTGQYILGTVHQYDNTIAPDARVMIYRLNSSATDLVQVDNVFTDSLGEFLYFTKDTSACYFQAITNSGQFSGQITAYQDSAIVVQASPALYLDTMGHYNLDIKLVQAASSPGNLTFRGKIFSSTERTGSVRLVLMLNNNPVASILSNVDGTFSFPNIASAYYTLWVDKYTLNNANAPWVTITNSTSDSTYSFMLYPDHLELLVMGINSSEFNKIEQIFPNPFIEDVTVAFYSSVASAAKLQILDINGKQMLEKDFAVTRGNNSVNISGSKFPHGIYFCKIFSSNKIYYGKMIK